MLLIRRLWLLPALFIASVLYYLFLWPATPDNSQFYYGNIHWQKQPEKHPVTSYESLPKGSSIIPRIQYDFTTRKESEEEKILRLSRRQKIEDAFTHAWSGYKRYSYGRDEVKPLSGLSFDSFGGWGATLVDSLDTLWIMGMKHEFEEAVNAVLKIDFTINTESHLNVFETTIRYLGGMLAAYDLSEAQYPALLKKATELGDMLYAAFDTPNRMPMCRWDWRKSAVGDPIFPAELTLLAEIGSLSLEFTRLSQLTNDMKYYDAIARIAKVMANAQDGGTGIPGLWPTVVDAKGLRFHYNHFTLGGMADSTYEYLPKQYMLLSGADLSYRTMYEKALHAAKQFLFFRPMIPTKTPVLFSGSAALDEAGHPSLDAEGQHLTCFAAGMVGIGSQIFDQPGDLRIAQELLDGCIWAYNATPSGLMPETFHVVPCSKGVDDVDKPCPWDEDKYYAAVARQQGAHHDETLSPTEQGKRIATQKKIIPGFIAHGDNRYILRPEAIESVFILYRITGDKRYQDDAWKMWQAIDKATRTDIANAAVVDVRDKSPEKSDRMESFWLAETLKYFYLVFSDEHLVSLDHWVLNTEAHPFKRSS